MGTISLSSEKIKEFVKQNKDNFENDLLLQAVNVREKIDDILKYGNIDLINNAHRLVILVIDRKEQELMAFAKQEGIAWATHQLTLGLKLEWVQAIRRTLWSYIKKYNDTVQDASIQDFFEVEKLINNQLDQFLNTFFINYSTYKDQLILSQRKLVENLSVPIIPITPSVSILPLIGTVDSFRVNILEEKALTEIGESRIETLILDLSGIAEMEADVIDNLMKIIEGSAMMGCNTVITGLRTEVVRKMISLGRKFDKSTRTLGTLQQALNEYI